MKNLLIKYINVIGLLSLLAFSLPSTLILNNKEIATKLQIETNLEEKVVNVISKIYNVNKFAVTTNVVLLSNNQNSNNNQTVQSFGALQLEGILPAVPSTNKTGVAVDNSDYRISIKDITIWLDYDLNIIDAENRIKQFLFEAMDWLAECESCIQFRSMKFPASDNISPSNINLNSSAKLDNVDLTIIEDNIEYLMNQIDKLTEDEDTDGVSKNQWMIDFLSRNLEDKKNEIEKLQEDNKEQTEKVIKHYENSQSVDSLLKLELVKGNTDIALTAMDNNMEVTKSNKPDNTLLYVVLCILIGIILLLIILDKRGPKTVYLKPKDQKSNKDKQIKTQVIDETTNQKSTREELDTTTAYIDDSVVQSDLKSMKQSAVKMSVGQKKGASQIVQDWLDDGGDTEDENNNDSTEENSNA